MKSVVITYDFDANDAMEAIGEILDSLGVNWATAEDDGEVVIQYETPDE